MAQDQGQRQEYAKKYGQIVAKAWADEAFKQRLLENPTAVLKEQGIELPAGTEAKVVELQPHQVSFVLPPRPGEAELSDEELDQVAGGGCCCDCLCIGGASFTYVIW